MKPLFLAAFALLFCMTGLWGQEPVFHTATEWDLQPSFKYDALCLLNTLSGDPYYLHYYQAEYGHFHPLFTAGEQAAFVDLKSIFKDQGGGIISATLTLYFSATDADTLPAMIRVVQDSSSMESAYGRRPTGARKDGTGIKKHVRLWRLPCEP